MTDVRMSVFRGSRGEPGEFVEDTVPVEEGMVVLDALHRIQATLAHVLRNHVTENEFVGPRFLVRVAGLEMHPIDTADRREFLKDDGGVGYCNITKCCTEVCPEHIKITDNAIIPLKERVADRYYDPIQMVWQRIRGKRTGSAASTTPTTDRGDSAGFGDPG